MNIRDLLDAFTRPKPASRFSPAHIEAETSELHHQLATLTEEWNSLRYRLDHIRAAHADLGREMEPALRARFARQESELRAWGAWIGLHRERLEFRDYFMCIASPTRQLETRIAAVDWMIERFKMKRIGPFDPGARVGAEPDVRTAVVTAIWETCYLALTPASTRLGAKWAVDAQGHKAEVMPAFEFGIASEQFETWFASRVGRLTEADLRERSGEQLPENSHARYDPIEGRADPRHRTDAEAARYETQDALRLLTDEERKLLAAAAACGGLNARDRKRLERLRKKIRSGMSQS